MIIGFGKTEENTARNIIKECYYAIRNKSFEEAKEAIKDISAKYKEFDKEVMSLERQQRPERYSYFYHYLYKIYEDEYIIEFNFMHINTNHPFSDDGVALLQTYWILRIMGDEYRIYREV